MAEQLFQIGIKGLIRNEAGQILMVHIPAWGHNPEHWDLPGGRMEPGETFLQTLARELQEEIGTSFSGVPRQFGGILTNITIPVEDLLIPLVMIIYEVALPQGSTISLDADSAEDAYEWVSPKEAAERMAVKFPQDFCQQIRALAS
jgi:mutator protein MutT